jgi:predicted DNA binding CopG/RHH family protein
MELPKHFQEAAFNSALTPGSIIRCSIKYSDGSSSIKRLVVISSNNEKTVLLLSTTSNKFAPTRSFGCDDIYVSEYLNEGFEVPTYIQLHRVLEKDTKELKSLFNIKKLDILKKISSELLMQILEKIPASELIEQKYIKRIIAENKGFFK